MRKSKPTDTNGVDTYAKVPPNDVELEKAILGICLIERDAYEVMNEIIANEKVFYYNPHRVIFAAIQSMTIQQRGIDLLTVIEELTTIGKIAEAGGPLYITELTNDVVSSAHLEEYCLRVQQKYISRVIIEEAQQAIARAYANVDCFDNADTLIRNVELASQKVMGAEVVSFQEGVHNAITLMGERRSSDAPLTGIPSGYTMLDSCTHGWQGANLIILAARPAVGKTDFALNLAWNAANNPGDRKPVAFFSMEMSTQQLVERLISRAADVKAEKVTRADFEDAEFEVLTATMGQRADAPLYIDDTAGLNVVQLRAKARRLVRLFGIQLIIVDYLQLMSDVADGGERNRNREQVISNISRSLKKLAKELGIPIIALSQLSRAVETRGGEKIPQLSDLRESGAIEQDADVVMFMYRPEYYGITHNEMGDDNAGATDIRIAKHRNGTLETIRLKARFDVHRFDDWEVVNAAEMKSNPPKKLPYTPSTMWIPVKNRYEKDEEDID